MTPIVPVAPHHLMCAQNATMVLTFPTASVSKRSRATFRIVKHAMTTCRRVSSASLDSPEIIATAALQVTKIFPIARRKHAKLRIVTHAVTTCHLAANVIFILQVTNAISVRQATPALIALIAPTITSKKEMSASRRHALMLSRTVLRALVIL